MFSRDLDKNGNVVRQLHDVLRGTLSSEAWQSFDEQKVDGQRVKVLLGMEKLRDQIETCVNQKVSQVALTASKDKAKAAILKNAGNKAFINGENQKALLLYSECLSWMPQDDPKEAAIVYANRSACLFHLEEYLLALQDTEIAFSLSYPEDLHYKLHERAGRCYLHLGKIEQASHNFHRAITSLKKATRLDAAKISQFKSNVENTLNNLTNHTVTENTPIQIQIPPEPTGGRGEYFRNASRHCEVTRNDEEGRFVIASEDIQPGDILFSEKAFASAMVHERCHSHCFQCFSQMRAPVYCSHCSVVSYCSPKCKDSAWITHHRFECPILGFLHASEVSIICYLSIRILTQSNPLDLFSWCDMAEAFENNNANSLPNGLNYEFKQRKIHHGSSNGPLNGEIKNAGGDYYRTDHVAFLQFVSHSQEKTVEDNLHQTVMALYLMFALKRTDLFKCILEKKDKVAGKYAEEEITKEMIELKIATLLLRSIKLCQFNTFEITAWDTIKKTCVCLGAGIYNTLTLCNHSCSPSLVRVFYKDQVVARAVQTIRQGEQVTGNYGPVYTQSDGEHRRTILYNGFWFNCRCEACVGMWPTFDQLSRQDMANFRCQSCRHVVLSSTNKFAGFVASCPKCSQPTNILKCLKALQDIEKEYEPVKDLMANGKYEMALATILKMISLLELTVAPPYSSYHIWQEAARLSYLNLANKILPLDK